MKSKETKFNYAHFPTGTICEVFIKHITKEPVIVTVTKLFSNGLNSYVIETDTPCKLTGFKGYNIGPGVAKVEVNKSIYRDYDLVQESFGIMKPNTEYYTFSQSRLIGDIVKDNFNTTPDMIIDCDKLIKHLWEQGVLKECNIEIGFDRDMYIKANKKQLKKAIGRLLNKCLKKHSVAEAERDEEDREYYEEEMRQDMELDILDIMVY